MEILSIFIGAAIVIAILHIPCIQRRVGEFIDYIIEDQNNYE